ncbi:peptidase S8/S53 domain-containing protein [Scheffersomyces amazonensis]|uniref:peptidase S8/S53 domain-containing protein n=1 Tax=Scheffersomyces amazonensis TaxID=1078765 RepID=UPI00315CC193
MSPFFPSVILSNRCSYGTDTLFIYEIYCLFKDDITEEQRSVHLSSLENSGIETFFLGNSFQGYFGQLTDLQLEILRDDPAVDYVEEDYIGEIANFRVQKDATWALSSISHRSINKSEEYLYDDQGGEGVTVYVIDTGIKIDHEQFEGRAEWIASLAFPYLEVDYTGHGTHVAGIIGSKTYGVAKKSKLKSIAVSKWMWVSASDLIKGLEIALGDHLQAVNRREKGFKGSVINLSIALANSTAVNMAIETVIKAGIHVAVAAGNNGFDACQLSPANAPSSICVGAIGPDNNITDFSNWGPCVDIFAPGYRVKSTFIVGGTAEMAGTSMSSPHVAGILAYLLSLYPEQGSEYAIDVSTESLKAILLKHATKGVIGGLDDATPNLLAYNGGFTNFWKLDTV